MRYDPEKHHRRTTRLQGYDYSQPGAYFVTLVTVGRACLFGSAPQGEMHFTESGAIVAKEWKSLASRYPNVQPDEWVVMPNHLHRTVVIVESDAVGRCRGGSRTAPTGHVPGICKPLGGLIGAFKTMSTKRINASRGTPGCLVWQGNFIDRVLRDDGELDRIRRYIALNPARWTDDQENPSHDHAA